MRDIAGRIDIENQPLSDLVAAMHEHAVARVIFAAGHSQLNRVEAGDRRLRSGRRAGVAGGEFYPDLDREAGLRRLRRAADAGLSFDAGCFVGAADQAHDRSRSARFFLLVLFALPMFAVAIGVKLDLARAGHFQTGAGGETWEAVRDV